MFSLSNLETETIYETSYGLDSTEVQKSTNTMEKNLVI